MGDDWTWVAVVGVPVMTGLLAALRTGTALALILLYAFGSATAMAVQGIRLGWGEAAQVQYVFSHFATVFFMAASVALIAQFRSFHQRLESAQELVSRYVSEDEATGLLTRDAFKNAASREFKRSWRTSRPFLLLTIDLSGYFRPAADSATLASAQRVVGRVLCSQTRGEQDLWTMWDKDVYLGLLVETDERAVQPALERVLSRMADAPEFSGQAVVDTALFGLAIWPTESFSLDTLLERATTNLVPLKELRKRVEAYALDCPGTTTLPAVH